jgi:murein DD-endopeptidase MepM/ murein hydrolase activator NlpD
LAFKRIIIVLVPEGTSKPQQFGLPRFLAVSFVFLLVFFFACLPWIMSDYHAVRAKMFRLAQLQKENEHQAGQFIHLSQRVDQITRKMLELDKLDRKLRVLTSQETSDDSGRFVGVGGSESYLLYPHNSVANTHQDLGKLKNHSLGGPEREALIGGENKTELNTYLEDRKLFLSSTPYIWPVKGWLSSGFGYRISPFSGEREFHKGIDISSRKDTPIVAPADGIVAFVGRDLEYGNMISIKHGYGLVTRYGHLEKTLVQKGQYVKRNKEIGLVGNTGRSRGPHLYYEVCLNGVPVDPTRYILN